MKICICLSVCLCICLSSSVTYAQSKKQPLTSEQKLLCYQNFKIEINDGAKGKEGLYLALYGDGEIPKELRKEYFDKHYVFYNLEQKKTPLLIQKDQDVIEKIFCGKKESRINDDWLYHQPWENLILLVPGNASVSVLGSKWIIVTNTMDHIKVYFPAVRVAYKEITATNGTTYSVYHIKVYDLDSYCEDIYSGKYSNDDVRSLR